MEIDAETRTMGIQAMIAALSLVEAGPTKRLGLLCGLPRYAMPFPEKTTHNELLALISKLLATIKTAANIKPATVSITQSTLHRLRATTRNGKTHSCCESKPQHGSALGTNHAPTIKALLHQWMPGHQHASPDGP